MKYNIFTLFNSKYIKFAKIFLNSLYKTQNMDNINTIYIYDAGINDADKEWLQKFDKIKIIDDYETTQMDKIPEWTNVIIQKTFILKQLLEKEKVYPLVMIDIDCLFLKDISDLINLKFDLQVCKRDYKPKPLIASFVSFNNENVLPFIDLWIDKIKNIEKNIKETPALCNIYKKHKEDYKIGLVDYNIVSATNDKSIKKDTRIFHFKGTSLKSNSVENRLKIINSLHKIKNIKQLIKKYIGTTKCTTW